MSSNLHLLNFGTQYLPNTTHWTVNQEHADIYKMYLKSVNMTYYSPSLNTTISKVGKQGQTPAANQMVHDGVLHLFREQGLSANYGGKDKIQFGFSAKS